MKTRRYRMKSNEITMIKIERILFDDAQPRQMFVDELLSELAKSIEQDGLLQSIIVRKVKGKRGYFQVVVGARRVRAAQLAKVKLIPAVVAKLNDEKSFELALIENIQREDLTIFEEAYAFFKLMKHGGYPSVRSVALRVGKSQNYVQTRLKILQLPESIQKKVARGKIGLSQAIAISKIPETKQQEQVASLIVSESLTIEETESLVMNKTTHIHRRLKMGDIVSPVKVLERLHALLGVLSSAQWSELGKESRGTVVSQLRAVSSNLYEVADAIAVGDDIDDAVGQISDSLDDMKKSHGSLQVMLVCNHLEQQVRQLNWDDVAEDDKLKLNSVLEQTSGVISKSLKRQKK